MVVELDDEYEYIPGIDDEVAALPEEPAEDTPATVVDDSEAAGGEDDSPDEVDGVEGEEAGAEDLEPGAPDLDAGLGVDPLFYEMGDYLPLELTEAELAADPDEGELYSTLEGAPDDEAWEAADDAAPVARMAFAMRAVDEATPDETIASMTAEDFVTENESTVEQLTTDIDLPIAYEIHGKPPEGSWQALGVVAAEQTEAEVAGLPSGVGWLFRVRTVFADGTYGEWSAETAVDLPKDLLAPPVPSTPTVVGEMGVATLTWDGLGQGSVPQPADYKHTVVWHSLTGVVGTWNNVGIMHEAGQHHTTNLPYGQLHYFSLSSRDLMGNESARSAIISVMIMPLVDEESIKAALKDAQDQIDEAGHEIRETGSVLAGKLADARAELDAHDVRMTDLDADMDILVGEVLPDLEADLKSAGSRLTAAETELAASKVKIDTTLPAAITAAQAAGDMALLIAPRASAAPTVADGAGRPAGALWTQVDSTQKEVGYWSWTGQRWNAQALSTTVIPNLAASHITSGTVDTARLNASEIAAAVATFLKLNASAITAGTIDVERLNAADIAAKVATVIKLNASAINAGVINTDRLNAQEIAAATATFQKVDIKNLVATTGTMATAVIEKLFADVVRSRKHTTDMMLVGNGANLLTNPTLENGGEGWSIGNDIRIVPNGFAGASAIEVSGGLVQRGSYAGLSDEAHRFRVPGGTAIRVVGWVISTKPIPAGQAAIFARTYETGSTDYVWTSPSTIYNDTARAAGSWSKVEGIVVVPNADVHVALGYYKQSAHDGVMRWSGLSATVATDASLIVDGGVIARHVTASESLTAKIAKFLEIEAGMIKANAITADSIASGAVTAIKIQSNAVTTIKLDANAVTAEKIKAGAITADKIDADAINGKTITGATIQSDATAARGIKISGADLNAYATSGGGSVLLSPSVYGGRPGVRFDHGLSAGVQPNIVSMSATGGGYTARALVINGSEATANSTGRADIVLEHGGNWKLGTAYGTNNGTRIQATAGAVNIHAARGGVDVYAATAMSLVSGRDGTILSTAALGSKQHIFMPLITANTTTGAANVNVNVGWMREVSSASRYKLNVRTLDDSLDDALLSIEAKDWVDRSNAEILAEAMCPRTEEQAAGGPASIPFSDHRIPGVIAEEVAAAGLEQFVVYGDGGQVQGVMYDRLGVALIPVVRRQRDRINVLEQRLVAIEDRLAA